MTSIQPGNHFLPVNAVTPQGFAYKEEITWTVIINGQTRNLKVTIEATTQQEFEAVKARVTGSARQSFLDLAAAFDIGSTTNQNSAKTVTLLQQSPQQGQLFAEKANKETEVYQYTSIKEQLQTDLPANSSPEQIAMRKRLVTINNVFSNVFSLQQPVMPQVQPLQNPSLSADGVITPRIRIQAEPTAQQVPQSDPAKIHAELIRKDPFKSSRFTLFKKVPDSRIQQLIEINAESMLPEAGKSYKDLLIKFIRELSNFSDNELRYMINELKSQEKTDKGKKAFYKEFIQVAQKILDGRKLLKKFVLPEISSETVGIEARKILQGKWDGAKLVDYKNSDKSDSIPIPRQVALDFERSASFRLNNQIIYTNKNAQGGPDAAIKAIREIDKQLTPEIARQLLLLSTQTASGLITTKVFDDLKFELEKRFQKDQSKGLKLPALTSLPGDVRKFYVTKTAQGDIEIGIDMLYEVGLPGEDVTETVGFFPAKLRFKIPKIDLFDAYGNPNDFTQVKKLDDIAPHLVGSIEMPQKLMSYNEASKVILGDSGQVRAQSAS